jgi:hypothetical protein
MMQKSGVTSMSAGTPKLSMKTATNTPAPPPPQPMTAAVFENAFTAPAPVEVEEDPFGSVAVAEPVVTSEDDPFAPVAQSGRAGLEELLAGARLVVVSLEKALEVARDHERELTQRLKEL